MVKTNSEASTTASPVAHGLLCDVEYHNLIVVLLFVIDVVVLTTSMHLSLLVYLFAVESSCLLVYTLHCKISDSRVLLFLEY